MAHFGVGNLLVIPRSGQKIDKESKDIQGEDEGNDPLQDGGDVLVGGKGSADKYGSEENFDNDEAQLHPERGTKDAVLAEVTAEALILGADANGGDDVAADEEEKEAIMEPGMADGVEYGQKDQAGRSQNGEED